MPTGKFCKITPKNTQITPKNTHLHLKIRILFGFFLFLGYEGGHGTVLPYSSDCLLHHFHKVMIASGLLS